ncbi:MAG: hypothetical protein ABR564_03205 [Candidatus Dormibacteria bacterium]
MGRHRVLTATGAGIGLVSLAGASLAWACSSLAPSAYVSVNPGEAPPQTPSQVQVTTHYMSEMKGGTSASIIWADANNTYLRTLAPAPTTDSTTTVTVPAAAPGYYYINVYEGSFRATPATFTLPAPPGQPMPPKPANYGSPDTTVYGLGGRPAGSAPSTTNNVAAPAPRAQAQVPAQAQPQQAPGRTAVNAAPAGSTIAPKAAIFGTATAAAPESATSANPIPGAPQQPAAGGNVPASQVLGDLWGGFAKGKTNSQAPSLITTSDSGPGVGLTVGLLAAGLVALFAGFGIAEVRRTRATAMSTIE